MPENDAIVLLLSGPKAHRNQAAAACRQAGLPVHDGDPQHSWGHHDTPEGDEDPTVGWLTVHAAHPDQVPAGASGLGWGLRAHWQVPPPAEQLEVVPAGTLDRLDRIEQLLKEGGRL